MKPARLPPLFIEKESLTPPTDNIYSISSSNEAPGSGLKPNRNVIYLAIFFLIQFTVMTNYLIIMPMGLRIMAAFSLTTRQFGWAMAGPSLASFLSCFGIVFLTDRFEKRKMLWIFFGGVVLSIWICSFAREFTPFLLGRILGAACGGCIITLNYTMAIEQIGAERKAWALGTLGSASELALAIAIPAGLYLSARTGWYVPFLATAGLGTACWFASLFLPRRPLHSEPGTMKSALANLRKIFFNRKFTMALCWTMTFVISTASISPYLTSFWVVNLGIPEARMPIFYLLAGGCSALFGIPMGRLIGKMSARRTAIQISIISLIPIFAITALDQRSAYLALPAFMLLTVLSSLRHTAGTAAILDSVENNLRGSFLSVNTCMFNLGGACASLLSSKLVFKQANGGLEGFSRLGILAGGACVISLLLVSRLKKAKELNQDEIDSIFSNQ